MNVTDDQDVNSALEDLPPSAKLVYITLREQGPLGREDLTDRLAFADSTLQYAVDRLVEADLVERRSAYSDARKSQYKLKSTD